MPNLFTSFNRFVGQLKRRHVVQVAGAYAVGAFVVLQVGDILFEAFALPPLALTVLVVLLILGAPVTLALAWVFDVTPRGIERTPAEERAALSAASADGVEGPAPTDAAVEPVVTPADWNPNPASVAVLPFVNMTGGEENEYFSQGVTEEIILSLSRLHDVKVVSRTSVSRYRQSQQSAQEIARQLGVAMVMEGSVRRSSDRVRIAAQLVDARSDHLVWVESYDRRLEDIFEIQGDVAARIADSLHAKLTPDERQRLRREPTQDLEAYDLYLKGRYLWNKRTEWALHRSVRYFREALARDPQFAGAGAGLADAQSTLGIYGLVAPRDTMPLAREAAERALRLDPEMGEALVARGCVRAVYDWDWDGAERDYLRAIELEPLYPTAHHWYATNVLAPLGRFDEAWASLRTARELEPLNPAINATFAFFHRLEGDLETAARRCREVIEVEHSFPLAHYFLAETLEALERYDEAEATLKGALELSGRTAEILSAFGRVYAKTGRTERARGVLEEIEEMGRRYYVSRALLGRVRLALGERAEAVAELREATRQRAAEMVWLRSAGFFGALEGEPAYEAILAEVGFPR
jgi:TolB-like protein/Flp pilus assembly protein TadD